jgi:hypothetical protein
MVTFVQHRKWVVGCGLLVVVAVAIIELAAPNVTPSQHAVLRWVAIGAGAVIVSLWLWDGFSEERQQSAMAKFARATGWDFAFQTMDYTRWFRGYPFDQGREPRDLTAVQGTYSGRRCASFTHEVVTSIQGENKQTECWQITLVELPYPLSVVEITPEDGAAKAEIAIGGQDIKFESQAFNDAWRVRAGNLKYAHDVIHPRMMERLLKPDAAGIAIRIEGRAVLSWQAGRRGPEDLARRLGVLTSVAKLIPDFVLREFEYEWKRLEEEARKREENAPGWAKTPGALTSGRYTELGKQLARDEYNKDLPPGISPHDDENRAW